MTILQLHCLTDFNEEFEYEHLARADGSLHAGTRATGKFVSLHASQLTVSTATANLTKHRALLSSSPSKIG